MPINFISPCFKCVFSQLENTLGITFNNCLHVRLKQETWWRLGGLSRESVSPPALPAWVYYSYLPYLSAYQEREEPENQYAVHNDAPDVLHFFKNVFIVMFSKFFSKHKLSTETCRQRISCLLSADWIIFNYCFCILAERSWVQGWPSVTGNIPGCLKVALTCCGKPTARCRQRRAALKKTNISSEMRFLCIFLFSFLFPVI